MKTLPDFDTLRDIAKSSPEYLEKIRKELSDEIIENSPSEDSKRRLRGLQFKINTTIQLSKNPMSSCIKISNMMHESLSRLSVELNDFSALSNQGENLYAVDSTKKLSPEIKKPNIIEFSKTPK
jgi:hypothetical protein